MSDLQNKDLYLACQVIRFGKCKTRELTSMTVGGDRYSYSLLNLRSDCSHLI